MLGLPRYTVYSSKTIYISPGSSSLGLSAVCYILLRSGVKQSEEDGGTKEGKEEKRGSFHDLFTPVPVMVYVIYLLVSVVRGACNDWGQLYLIQEKGQSIATGSSFTSSQEVGGIVGSLITGYISDYLISKDPGKATPRLTIVMWLSVMQTVALYLFVYFVTAQSSHMWIGLISFFIGFGMYSNIALLGICSMEVTPGNLAGTAHSMAALGGNIGRIIAGYPLSLVATWWSWHQSFFVALEVSVACIVVTLLCRRRLLWQYANQSKAKIQ